MLPHAPGVQMQATPEDAIPDDNVDEDTEDPDKRLSSTTEFINLFFFHPRPLQSTCFREQSPNPNFCQCCL